MMKVILLAAAMLIAMATAQVAVYTQTNDATGNNIVISTLSASGVLTYQSKVSTGGLGSMNTPAADALYSQRAVTVCDTLLFAVNGGSSSLSVFYLTNNGLTATLISVVSSQGTFPVSVTCNAKLRVACVLNGGATNGVACFSISSTLSVTLASKVLLNVNGISDLPSAPAGTFGDIVFDSTASNLLVALKGTPTTSGTIFVVPLSASLILGTPVSNTIAASNVLFALENIGGSTWLWAEATGGYGTFTLTGTTISGATKTAIPGINAACWTTYSKKSGKAYVVGALIATVSVTTSGSTITSQLVTNTTIPTGSLDSAVVTVSGTEYFVAVSTNLLGLVSLAVDSSTGALSSPQALNLTGVAISNRRLQGVAFYTASSTSAAGAVPAISCVLGAIALAIAMVL